MELYLRPNNKFNKKNTKNCCHYLYIRGQCDLIRFEGVLSNGIFLSDH